MTWVLIYWITVGSAGSFGGIHSSTSSIEFSDEAACHAAFAAMKAAKNYTQGLWGICTPKRTTN